LWGGIGSAEAECREQVEKILALGSSFSCAALAIMTTVGIGVFPVFFETNRFFGMVSLYRFLFGTNWSRTGRA